LLLLLLLLLLLPGQLSMRLLIFAPAPHRLPFSFSQ
jgi:hypothetical protein